MDRPRNAREHLLGLGAAAGAIAAADLAGDHRGPDGLLGAPVRRVDRRVPEEGEDSGEFDGQVGGESFGFLQCRWVVDQTTEPGKQSTAGSCKTMVAQVSGIATVAQLESVLQDGLYPGRPPAAWMIGSQVPSAAKEVSQTGLVQRAGEAPIRRPSVAHQDAVEVGAEYGGGVVEAAAGANRVGGRLRGGKGPQPVGDRAHSPARLIGRDHGTVPHLSAQRGIGRRGLASRPVEHVDEAARRDGDAELRTQQVRDLRQRHPQVCVHPHDQRDGFRTELHARGAQRVGGLELMPALHASPTPGAVTDLDVEAPNDRTHHRELFLILRRHTGHHHLPPQSGHAAGAGALWVSSICARAPAAAVPAVPCTRAPARTPPATSWSVLGEGSRLSEPCPPSRVELLLEVVALPLELFAAPPPSIPVPLAPLQLLAQPLDRSFLFPNVGIAGILFGRRTLPWHHPVMPQPRK